MSLDDIKKKKAQRPELRGASQNPIGEPVINPARMHWASLAAILKGMVGMLFDDQARIISNVTMCIWVRRSIQMFERLSELR